MKSKPVLLNDISDYDMRARRFRRFHRLVTVAVFVIMCVSVFVALALGAITYSVISSL